MNDDRSGCQRDCHDHGDNAVHHVDSSLRNRAAESVAAEKGNSVAAPCQ
jgi:hypothetical protein